MTIHNLNNTLNKNRDIIIYIIRLIVIQNAINDGWNVKQLNSSTYEFTKLCNEPDDFNFMDFINKITYVE